MNEPVTATIQWPNPPSAGDWFLTHAALDFLDQGISVYDRDLRLVGWNRRFFELLDFPPELARVGTPFAEFIRYNARRGEYGPGDTERQVAERVDLALRFESHCFERVRPDGTVLEVRGNPIADGGFVTIYSDVTERKRAEAALRESHEQLETRVAIRTAKLEALNQRLTMEVTTREQIAEALRERERWLQLITDAVPALIAYVDAEQRYVFVNRTYEEWFGIPIDEILGHRYGTLLGPSRPDRLEKAMDMALKGYTANLDREVTNREGRTLHLRCSLVPHVGTDGRVLGFFSLAHDLTEYRKTQQALNQALKMEAIGQLTSGIAHDFKNLLTVIVGHLALLEDDLPDRTEAQDSVATAMNAARRGAALTRRLLAFSRHQPLEPRVIEPRRLMTSIDAFLRCALGETVALETRADDKVWNVLADPNQLTNALLNLAINAREVSTPFNRAIPRGFTAAHIPVGWLFIAPARCRAFLFVSSGTE